MLFLILSACLRSPVGYAVRTFQPISATLCIVPFALLLYFAAPAVSAEVSVNGLAGEAKKNVQLMLSLTKEPCQASEWKIRGLFDNADEEISQALRALGYYHPVIDKSLAFNAKCWQADFTIASGPQVIIGDITITLNGDARDDAEFQKLRNALLTANGKPLRHDHYEKMKSRLETLAMERGYLQAAFSGKQLLIDKANNRALITLVFNTGKRRVFGDVIVEQDILNPEFVSRFISVKSGDFYSSEQLAKTHTALSKSGYFDRIEIRPNTENTRGNQVPVSIKLYPGKTRHYGFGVGFDTDIGPLVNAAYSNRRINRRGHFINANLDLAPVRSTADVEYNVPLDDPTHDFFSFGGGFKREDLDAYESLSAKLSARLKHAFDNGWKQTLFLDSLYEDFTIGSTSNQVLLLVPGGSWLRSVADNPMRPTRGYRLELNLAGSYENPISDISFAQGSVAAVWTHPLPWRGRFIARTEQGATLVDQFDKLPTSYRFFAGGMNSVRGYAYRDLGPKDNTGNVIGGKFLSVVSAEYEHYLFDNWGVAAFVDAGNAYNPGNVRIKTGVGLGVRWYSPIGPVRLDFALPLSESDSSFQIHFAAGTRL
ncbi:MAG: autotransporter assembly complex family protein [Methylobacter sp.]|uniref:autotransporter assembly complex protein TamA n=1 Tax=Methylobacter sp. TaxID=2051955 RepID=UPI00272F9439|nr:autotransporter assembly complex family protein [Methylobacter sp.]MDP1666553.1 autotransporter assembly complex family protein [Methylobacter sp.]